MGTWSALRLAGMDTAATTDWREHLDALEAHRERRGHLEQALRLVPDSQRGEAESALAEAKQHESDLMDTAVARIGEVDPRAGRDRAPGEAQLLVVPVGMRGPRVWRALWRDDRGLLAGAPLTDAQVRADPASLLPLASGRLVGADVVTLLLPAALEVLDLHLVPVDIRFGPSEDQAHQDHEREEPRVRTLGQQR